MSHLAAVRGITRATTLAGLALLGSAAAAAGAASPTLEELKNATYQGIEGTSVTLANGRWEGAPYEPGGVVRQSANLVREYVTYGNLDNDADDEAVVFVNWTGGGTGQLLHLAVVGRDGDAVRNVATVLIGDRVQIRDTRIADGQIVVDVVRAGEKDAMCCPGELATLSFALGKDGLAKVRDEATGRLTLDTLVGSEWVLRSWTFWEPAPAEPEVTLSYADGRLAGSGGCNRYFADAKAGDMPGDLTVGPAGSTRMACPDPLMQVEDRFLKQLAGVHKFGFMARQLMLGYQVGDSYGVMLFDRRAPDAAATHLLVVHEPSAQKPVTSRHQLNPAAEYNLEFIEPGIQNHKVEVYRSKDARQTVYNDTSPQDHRDFHLVVVGIRNPDYSH